MHGGPGARAARLMRLLPPDPRGASRLHLPVLSRPRKTHPRLLGPAKLTLATDFLRYDALVVEAINRCVYRKLYPDVMVMESAEDRR